MALHIQHGDEADLEDLHEINVTPFIDVMLVLLIIFMVAAPLATVDQKVELPESNAPPTPKPDKPVYLTVKADLSLAVGDAIVAHNALAGALDAATNRDRDARIYLRADETVPYGELMRAMNLLRDAGYLKVALVGIEAPRAQPGARAP